MTPVRIAIIGAGIFARDAHLPAMNTLGKDTFQISAIWSRSLETAQRLAETLDTPVEATNDLNTLLARDDIDAVDVVLPLNVMSSIVEQALTSGKHVISEKPIAPDVATARRLIARQKPGQVWMVAENHRYNDLYIQVAELIEQGAIGKPLLTHFSAHIPVTPESKYFDSQWRRGMRYGWLVDTGVHHIATLRLALGEIAEVSAFSTQASDDLGTQDTLTANLRFASGLLGNYSATYAAGPFRSTTLIVRGETGRMTADRQGIEIAREGDTEKIASQEIWLVDEEFKAFAAAIREGKPHRNTAQQALQDLAVMEAMTNSAGSGQVVQVEQVL